MLGKIKYRILQIKKKKIIKIKVKDKNNFKKMFILMNEFKFILFF
jgi:hypothetical protein